MCYSFDLLLVIRYSDFPVPILVCVLADSVFGSPLSLTFRYSDLGLPFDYDSCSVLIKSCFFTFTVCIWVLHFSPPNHTHNTILFGLQQYYVNLSHLIFCCISFACHEFLVSLTYQHHQNLDVLHTGCATSDETMHLNGSLWELRGGTRFCCELCRYSMEHICWLNGFKSRVQGMKWPSNHRAAARSAVNTKIIVSPDKSSCWA